MVTTMLRSMLISAIFHISSAALYEGGTVRFGAVYPTTVEVFITSGCNSITSWMVQYRQLGNKSSIESLSTVSTAITAARVKGLQPVTQYQFRARISQLYGSINVLEDEFPFPEWENSSTVTTSSSSIFGKVTLTNETYTPAYNKENSAEWNASLIQVQNAYSANFSILASSVSALWIQKSDGGKPIVHYRVYVEDRTLPSSTNYSITGAAFANCYINYGEKPPGTSHIATDPFVGDEKHTIWYESPTSTCPKAIIVMRYMDVAPEDSEPFSVYLNLASPTSSVTSEEDGLAVMPNGELRRDDNVPISRTLSEGILVGLTPRILVKDCLNGEEIFGEIFNPIDYFSGKERGHIWENTRYSAPTATVNGTICESSIDGTMIDCSIPSTPGGIKYDIIDDATNSVIGTATEENVNCTSMPVQVRASNLNESTTYNLTVVVTVRNSDGTTQSSSSLSTISVTTSEGVAEMTSKFETGVSTEVFLTTTPQYSNSSERIKETKNSSLPSEELPVSSITQESITNPLIPTQTSTSSLARTTNIFNQSAIDDYGMPTSYQTTSDIAIASSSAGTHSTSTLLSTDEFSASENFEFETTISEKVTESETPSQENSIYSPTTMASMALSTVVSTDGTLENHVIISEQTTMSPDSYESASSNLELVLSTSGNETAAKATSNLTGSGDDVITINFVNNNASYSEMTTSLAPALSTSEAYSIETLLTDLTVDVTAETITKETGLQDTEMTTAASDDPTHTVFISTAETTATTAFTPLTDRSNTTHHSPGAVTNSHGTREANHSSEYSTSNLIITDVTSEHQPTVQSSDTEVKSTTSPHLVDSTTRQAYGKIGTSEATKLSNFSNTIFPGTEIPNSPWTSLTDQVVESDQTSRSRSFTAHSSIVKSTTPSLGLTSTEITTAESSRISTNFSALTTEKSIPDEGVTTSYFTVSTKALVQTKVTPTETTSLGQSNITNSSTILESSSSTVTFIFALATMKQTDIGSTISSNAETSKHTSEDTSYVSTINASTYASSSNKLISSRSEFYPTKDYLFEYGSSHRSAFLMLMIKIFRSKLTNTNCGLSCNAVL